MAIMNDGELQAHQDRAALLATIAALWAEVAALKRSIDMALAVQKKMMDRATTAERGRDEALAVVRQLTGKTPAELRASQESVDRVRREHPSQ